MNRTLCAALLHCCRYGSGYSVVVRCHLQRVQEARSLVLQRLKGSAVVEAHLNQVKFHVPPHQELRLVTIFRAMDEARRDGSVLDYSISQTTLEDVSSVVSSRPVLEVQPHPQPHPPRGPSGVHS